MAKGTTKTYNCFYTLYIIQGVPKLSNYQEATGVQKSKTKLSTVGPNFLKGIPKGPPLGRKVLYKKSGENGRYSLSPLNHFDPRENFTHVG